MAWEAVAGDQCAAPLAIRINRATPSNRMMSTGTSRGRGRGTGTGTGAASGNAIGSEPPTKKRRCTYYKRKSELAALEAEVTRLTSELGMAYSERDKQQRQARRENIKHGVLRDDIRRLQLSVTGAQSMIAGHISTWLHNPIESYIHLPSDWSERQRMLMGVLDEKMRLATAFLLERTRSLDLARRYRHRDEFDTSNGDYVVTRFDVTPMQGQINVKLVYDELIRFFANQEYVVADNSGLVTVRDTDHGGDAIVSQCRFMSAITDGLDVEANTVRFTRLTDHSEQLGLPHGLVVIDFVDEDELYPYHPETRVREDVSLAVLVVARPPCGAMGLPTTHKKDDPAPSISSPSAVTLVSTASMRFRRPRCSTNREKELQMYERMAQWGEVMHKVMRERMTPKCEMS